jgi:hypothetical protein
MNSIAEILVMSIERALKIGGTLLIKLNDDGFHSVEDLATKPLPCHFTGEDLRLIDSELAKHGLRRGMSGREVELIGFFAPPSSPVA